MWVGCLLILGSEVKGIVRGVATRVTRLDNGLDRSNLLWESLQFLCDVVLCLGGFVSRFCRPRGLGTVFWSWISLDDDPKSIGTFISTAYFDGEGEKELMPILYCLLWSYEGKAVARPSELI